MGQANLYEIYMLQLVNRARADPLAEAARYGIDLNQGLATGTLNGTAKQPLASNDLLVDAARAHSVWMLDVDQFSHTGVGGSSPGDRMTSAGYSFTGSWTWGENISWSGTTGGLGNLAGYVEQQHEGLFRSPGHRVNILKGEFRELGIGQVTGSFTDPPLTYNASMITQAFATTGTSRFLTGVVYDDADGDNFYDPGEGQAGVAITIDGAVLGTTTSAGAYSIALGDGVHAVSFGGGGLLGSYATSVTLSGSNVQVNAEAAQFSAAVPVASIGADRSVSEAAVRINYTVTLNAAAAAPVSVRWALADGSAKVGDDDMPAGQGGIVTIAAGQTSALFTLLVNDGAYEQEGTESFSVVLDQPMGVTLGRASAAVTLLDSYVAPPAVPLAMTNTTTKVSSTPAMASYTGPLSYLDQEFVYLGGDGIVLAANAPNVFLRSGSGDDALRVAEGQNVLDAGTGSNFLTGGSGADTFFLDARGATSPIWSTVVGLGAGDAVTVWGVSQASASFAWVEGGGAPGFTGLTVHATPGSGPTASLTLAGFVDADRTNGRLSILFGNDAASKADFMFVFANS